MALLTVDELKGFIPPTSIADAALAILLGAAEEDITERLGPVGDVTEFLRASGELLKLSRTATEIGTIVEDEVTLDETDFRLWPSGGMVQRLATGLHPRRSWRGRVEVTYTRVDDLDRRKRAQADLIKIEISFAPGLASQTIGAWSESYTTAGPSQADQREAVLASLDPEGFIL